MEDLARRSSKAPHLQAKARRSFSEKLRLRGKIVCMTLHFGTGLRLKELRPELRDDRQRHALILDVAERNCVIEGLPPFTDEFRQHLLKRLEEITRETAGRTDGPYSSG